MSKTLKDDLLDALDDAIELAVDYKRPVTEKNLRRVKARVISTIMGYPGTEARDGDPED